MSSSPSNYLRYPHLHDDLVTFVAADDIWLAPLGGGRAWRLTTDRVPVRTPRFSPDGRTIAFVSHRDGHPEVRVVDVETGVAQRLTWWGASSTLVLGWSADGRVLAASHAGEAESRHLTVRAVALDGSVEKLSYGPAWGVAQRAADGAIALVTPGSRQPAHWKRYRGGTAPRLWLDSAGTGSWQRLLADDTASIVDPMWVGDALVFVSDRAARLPDAADGQADLWALPAASLADGTGEPRRLTARSIDDGYVRDAATDGARIIWHSRGELWVLDSIDATPRRVGVTLAGVRPEPFAADPVEHLHTIVPDHGGDASLVGVRGAAFWMTHRDGPARALVADSSVRVREPRLLGRTGRAALVTDAQGDDAIEIQHLDGSEPAHRIASGELGRVLHLASDAAGERLAAISHDGRISLVDVASGAVTEVARSLDGEAASPSFSPDGRYLLWSHPMPQTESEVHRLMICDLSADTPTPVALTSGTVHDRDPAFTHDGRHIVFLSDRTFDPVYDTHSFDLAFTSSTRPWLLPLAATDSAPFGPSVEGRRISAADAATDAAPPAPLANTPPASPDLDADGAEDRVTPFPIASGDYRDLRVAKAGVLWVRAADDAGELGARRSAPGVDPTPDTLEFWSFDERQVTTVADRVDQYAVSGDGIRMVVHAGDEVAVRPTDRKPADDGHETVTVDLSRLRFQIDPGAEWLQMYDENARIMGEHFWRADMDGVDWNAVVTRWRPVAASVATHDDLVDLLWEVVGELNTSHAYVMPKSPLGDESRKLGLLGADLSPVDGGWRIDRVLPGVSTDPDARSPLRAAGVGASAGDVITHVDGVAVDAAFGPAAQLVGAANRPIELTLRRGGAESADVRRVAVVPLATEEVLRYHDWVRSRREYVREHSGGRLGYLHVPDMQSKGWAQLHRDLRQATQREGLIADVRYNRGGHTSQLVIQKLAARVVSWSVARQYETPMTYPDMARRGPVVFVANEYSGSDGDIVNAVAQAMQLGPVIGMRTWGGVVGIDGRFSLVDGTGITQPRYATWIEGFGYGVENHGVDPDIEVEHAPGDFFADADPQLDRAIAETLARLDSSPASEPPELPAPKVRRGG